ncbi:hypothetical protein HZA98_04665 [Candidatus Woesearchaeota archaeon]|nr:hypothetical protein [Candidatus Woesearchaeota archaeon]
MIYSFLFASCLSESSVPESSFIPEKSEMVLYQREISTSPLNYLRLGFLCSDEDLRTFSCYKERHIESVEMFRSFSGAPALEESFVRDSRFCSEIYPCYVLDDDFRGRLWDLYYGKVKLSDKAFSFADEALYAQRMKN